ncbi:AEC family transporter [Limnohabitans sp.]|uniref:AEC family transporter n=1 Tax=Limnohabitans sp. TaxID=1907725 RepID=UPI00286F5F23|nr:AEC family transporter [Limnohabitans sp.]
MLNILTITGPIYLSIGMGFAATQRGMFSKPDGQVMGRFVLNFGLPAMLFNALANRNFSDVLHPRYLVAYGVGSLLTFACGLLLWRKLRHKGLTESGLVAMGFSSSNSGYVGYPILLQVLGPAAGVALALTLLIENLLVIPLALAIAESGESEHASWQHTVKESLLRMCKLPMMWGIVLGFCFSMFDLELPSVFAKTTNMFAAACAALALFVNGGTLVGMRMEGLLRQVRWIALGKLVLHPLMVGLMLWVVGPMESSLQVSAILLAGMPMLGIYPLLAQRHGLAGFCASALLVTTVASFFTISLILWGMSFVPGWHI